MSAWSEMDRVYLDHNATTPVDSELKAELLNYVEAWGNPSSIHWNGRHPKNLIRDARSALATGLGVSPLEIVFTSGGSESNSSVFRSMFEYYARKNLKPFFVASSVEHPSVMRSLEHFAQLGARVEFIPVSKRGELDLNRYLELLQQKPNLVSIMFANNETGVINDIQTLCKMAHDAGALFHTDAVQAYGKLEFSLQQLNVDYASISAHKFYALKGAGVLFIKKNSPFIASVFGGGQERHRRGGTENTLGIAALGFMARKLDKISQKRIEIEKLRDDFEAKVMGSISDVVINCKTAQRLPNTSSMLIAGVDGETMLMNLDINGYAVSTGAACSSGNPEPSPVLLAMGFTRDEAQSSLRVSLGWNTTQEQLDVFVEELKATVARLRMLKANSQLQGQG
jgi:cysteine desulfurase